jgi:hypothetical protein
MEIFGFFIFFILNPLLMAPFYVCKMVAIHHQEEFSYTIKFILVFSKNLINL